MLNEIKEYEQYSFPIKTMNKETIYSMSRIKRKVFVNKFSGIDRAMITVARKWMFSHNKETARDALMLWCGAKSAPQDSAAEEMRNWLPNYIRFSLMQSVLDVFWINLEKNKKEKPFSPELCALVERIKPELSLEELQSIIDEIEIYVNNSKSKEILYIYNQFIKPVTGCVTKLKELSDKPKSYGQKMFRIEEKNIDKNDIKAITYEGVLAKAFCAGPLKRYYLCCDDNTLLKGDKYTEQQKDIILKTISAFLLNKNKNISEQQWVVINKTAIVNWLYDFNRSDEFKLEELVKFNDSTGTIDVSIFQTQKLSNNTVKLNVHEEWICHFKVVEENEIDDEIEKGVIYYQDNGSHSYLIENKKYDNE